MAFTVQGFYGRKSVQELLNLSDQLEDNGSGSEADSESEPEATLVKRTKRRKKACRVTSSDEDNDQEEAHSHQATSESVSGNEISRVISASKKRTVQILSSEDETVSQEQESRNNEMTKQSEQETSIVEDLNLIMSMSTSQGSPTSLQTSYTEEVEILNITPIHIDNSKSQHQSAAHTNKGDVYDFDVSEPLNLSMDLNRTTELQNLDESKNQIRRSPLTDMQNTTSAVVPSTRSYMTSTPRVYSKSASSAARRLASQTAVSESATSGTTMTSHLCRTTPRFPQLHDVSTEQANLGSAGHSDASSTSSRVVDSHTFTPRQQQGQSPLARPLPDTPSSSGLIQTSHPANHDKPPSPIISPVVPRAAVPKRSIPFRNQQQMAQQMANQIASIPTDEGYAQMDERVTNVENFVDAERRRRRRQRKTKVAVHKEIPVLVRRGRMDAQRFEQLEWTVGTGRRYDDPGNLHTSTYIRNSVLGRKPDANIQQVEQAIETHFTTRTQTGSRNYRKHLEDMRSYGRRYQKAERRKKALQTLKESMNPAKMRMIERVLVPEYMSDEERDASGNFQVKKLPWQSVIFDKFKKGLDDLYLEAEGMDQSRRQMTPRNRDVNRDNNAEGPTYSDRPAPAYVPRRDRWILADPNIASG